MEHIYAILKYDGSGIDEPTSSRKNCQADDSCRVFNCPFQGYASHLDKVCINLNDVVSAIATTELTTEYGLNQEADTTLFLNVGFNWKASINAKQFVHPSVPYSEPNFRNGLVNCDKLCDRPGKGCTCTSIETIPFNKTIDLVLSNYKPGERNVDHHVMHLHGHSFAVLKTGYPPYNISTGFYAGQNTDIICESNLCKIPQWNGSQPQDFNFVNPPIKDVVMVPARGYVVIRFRSTNPGPWFFHCHNSNHMLEGKLATANFLIHE